VFVAVAVSSSENAGGSTEAGLGPALAAALVYAALTMPIALWCDSRSRRSVRQIRGISAHHVLVSASLGESATVRREITRRRPRPIPEQRQLLDLLWRAAQADRARRQYLAGAVFDDGEFTPILDAAESSRADLASWRPGVLASWARTPARRAG